MQPNGAGEFAVDTSWLVVCPGCRPEMAVLFVDLRAEVRIGNQGTLSD
jgi:hypothetical protein